MSGYASNLSSHTVVFIFFCEFWDVSSPGFAPNPFCLSSGFGVFFLGPFLVGLVLRLRGGAWLALLLLL